VDVPPTSGGTHTLKKKKKGSQKKTKSKEKENKVNFFSFKTVSAIPFVKTCDFFFLFFG